MFSNSTYLLALAGLSIPVLIHFLSRKEGRVIKLGSVRHVVETSTQQFKGIKLNEIILLMLRCAMIVVSTLLLSGLQCSNKGKEKWAIVEKELERVSNINSILDSLENDGYSIHLLAKGFPSVKDSSRNFSEINYWQLVEELKSKNLSQAVVFSSNKINYFKGERPVLPSYIRWISQPSSSVDFPLRAIQLSRDSVSLITGHSEFDKTYFSTKNITTNASPIAITAKDTIKIILVSDPEFYHDRKVIKAALNTIEKSFPVKIKLMESEPSKVSGSADWCFWLSTQKVVGINAEYTIQIDLRSSNELVMQIEPNHWVITQRLNQEVALKNNLTVQLAILLRPERNLQDKIALNDKRMISDSLAWSSLEFGNDTRDLIHHEPADRYLIILLFALLIIERTIAYKRNQ